MTRVAQLYDLQQIDTGLDTRVSRMRQIDEQMGDREDLVAARAHFNEISGRLAEQQALLKQLSHDTEDTSQRLRSHDKKLYDGSVKNPKDLAQIQDEVAHLKLRLKELEDRSLDVMLAVEASEEERAEAQRRFDNAEHEQQQFHSGLLEEKDKLMGQAKVLQVKRQRYVTELPWADLQQYERLRRAKAGLAVVAVRGGLCGGCHVTVTAAVLRQARAGNELVACPTCGRILHPLGEVKYEEFNHDLDNINR